MTTESLQSLSDIADIREVRQTGQTFSDAVRAHFNDSLTGLADDSSLSFQLDPPDEKVFTRVDLKRVSRDGRHAVGVGEDYHGMSIIRDGRVLWKGPSFDARDCKWSLSDDCKLIVVSGKQENGFGRAVLIFGDALYDSDPGASVLGARIDYHDEIGYLTRQSGNRVYVDIIDFSDTGSPGQACLSFSDEGENIRNGVDDIKVSSDLSKVLWLSKKGDNYTAHLNDEVIASGPELLAKADMELERIAVVGTEQEGVRLFWMGKEIFITPGELRDFQMSGDTRVGYLRIGDDYYVFTEKGIAKWDTQEQKAVVTGADAGESSIVLKVSKGGFDYEKEFFPAQ